MKISMKQVVLFFLGVVMSTVMMANHPAAYMQKGAALIAKGKYNEAIRQFDSVIEKWCEYGAAYDYRCWCWMKTGNTDGAVADIVRALRTGEEREKTAEFVLLAWTGSAGGGRSGGSCRGIFGVNKRIFRTQDPGSQFHRVFFQEQ